MHLTLFGKIGSIASEYVMGEPLKSKCIPVLYYGLEACPVNKSLVKSFQFNLPLIVFLEKIFQIKDSSLILECIAVFNCSVLDAIKRRQRNLCNTFSMRIMNYVLCLEKELTIIEELLIDF